LEFNIIAAGIGGQGLVLFSEILAKAMLKEGHSPSFYVHSGLAQLGGSVRSHIRSGSRICPKISLGCADVILSLEMAEILHAVPYLKKGGKILISEAKRLPYHSAMKPELYPDKDKLTKMFQEVEAEPIFVPAHNIAREAGHIQALNMVMLGTLVALSNIVETENAVCAIRENIQSRADLNVEAFWKGYEFISGQDYA
jgi:indolepyruvate ferredoxin oxidoreductase beta subunit